PATEQRPHQDVDVRERLVRSDAVALRQLRDAGADRFLGDHCTVVLSSANTARSVAPIGRTTVPHEDPSSESSTTIDVTDPSGTLSWIGRQNTSGMTSRATRWRGAA